MKTSKFLGMPFNVGECERLRDDLKQIRIIDKPIDCASELDKRLFSFDESTNRIPSIADIAKHVDPRVMSSRYGVSGKAGNDGIDDPDFCMEVVRGFNETDSAYFERMQNLAQLDSKHSLPD